MKCMAQWDYKSSLATFEKGSVMDYPQEMAEAINRDSPGVLVETKEKQGSNRSMSGPQNAAVVTTAPVQELIDKTVFKAVKDKKK